MISARAFIDTAARQGFDFYTGVPCSFLSPLINGVLNDRATLRYVGATNEGEAVAIAAGAWLAGRRPVVMFQNSGLGNAVNPLTSLNAPFHIPALLVTTWRGQPGLADEPQHEVMGQITQDLISLLNLEQEPFPKTGEELVAALARASDSLSLCLPYAMVMEKGSVAEEKLEPVPPRALSPGQRIDLLENGERPTRFAALQRFLAVVDEATAIIATTGKCGRELFTLADRPQHFYLVGSMGGASAVGLGVALNSRRRVVVLDGDGAALMKMGNFATIGAEQPAGLVHIVLDNGVHDSTGGQATVSATVDFTMIALACGYRTAVACDSLDGFAEALARVLARPQGGPALIHLRIRPGSLARLGRPTVAPPAVARRFRAFLAAPP